MAKFKITIRKIEEGIRKGTEYQKISDTGNEKDGKSVYGYVPAEVPFRNESEIFECEVEKLEITQVITAIYNL